tara:strand:- start:191 stop:2131 length:1941 start_codon:yes stop_codon:yes gene_type:complete
MVASAVQLPSEMPEEITPSDAGRQGGVEAACEGLTFEDMFNYTHAVFDMKINDDWESAEVSAVAWVNGTLADQVRTDLEDLFEPLGSNNGWLSSDEYNAIEQIAAECVTQTNPRVGFRAGPSHRGGDSVNWYNASWINTEDHPLSLEEYNLMPPHHVDERPCTVSSPNSDCTEIPVVPITEGRNCDTTVNQPDECRIVIWLNGTFEFTGLTAGDGIGNDEFTVAMNTSNMTNADLHLTYPALSGLRVGAFEECDGRLIDAENNDNQGAAPVPGTCTGDESITQQSRLVSIGGETRLRVDTHVTYDMEDWPTGQDMFFDMTTEPPEIDDPPVWTVSAPAEGEILPLADDGPSHFVSTDQMASWASDDQGSPLITCTGADGWSMTSDGEGLMADAPDGQDSTTVTCHATDSSGQDTDTRSYTLQVPLRTSGSTSGGSASIVVTPTSGMPSMDVVVTLVQDNAQTSSLTTMVTSENTISVGMGELSPGPFMVKIQASGSGMASFSHTYDLSLAKESSPPTITIAMGEWIDENYELTGQFSDPDGDSVVITATNNGNNWGSIQTSGNQWLANGPGIPGADANTIVFTACDSWNQCTTLSHDAGETPGGSNTESTPVQPIEEKEGGGLPGFGIFAALGAIALAGIGRKPRD